MMAAWRIMVATINEFLFLKLDCLLTASHVPSFKRGVAILKIWEQWVKWLIIQNLIYCQLCPGFQVLLFWMIQICTFLRTVSWEPKISLVLRVINRSTRLIVVLTKGTDEINLSPSQYWEEGGLPHSHPLAVTVSQCSSASILMIISHNEIPLPHPIVVITLQHNSPTPIIQMSHLIQGTKGAQLQIILSYSPY